MQRGDYDQIPNRIIPPHMSILDPITRRPEYEIPRAGRTLLGPPPTTRQPLLGDAPVDRIYYPRAPMTNSMPQYNGPIVDVPRRRGFDKGPQETDFAPRVSTRQPLLRTPRLAVEHIGGDMDIARSRSNSPEVRIVNARDVRDDRKKNRDRAKRSRSRSRTRRSRSRSRTRRSRSRSRSRRSRSRSRSRNREYTRDRGFKTDRDERIPDAPISHDQFREGGMWTDENHYDFLNVYVKLINEQSVTRGMGRLFENVTKANNTEKERTATLSEYRHSDQGRLLHCDTTVEGLPMSIFYGSGFGTRQHYAKFAAAKDLIDKCHRIGVINSDLYTAIGEASKIDKAFEKMCSMDISKAVRAVVLLIEKMSREVLPEGFMTFRQLDPDIIDRFKIMLRMVMVDVYYQGIESSVSDVPKDLKTEYDSRIEKSHSGSPFEARNIEQKPMYSNPFERGNYGSNAEAILAEREKDLQIRIEQELEKKKQEMEQEIRKKILEEERAKIRAELEMEKKIDQMMKQQQQFEVERERERKEHEEQQKKLMMTQQVEEDFYALVEQLEQRFVEIRARGLNNVLQMIYDSSTFKTIQVYSSTLTSMTFEQKQKLVVDLRSLLGNIAASTQVATVQVPPTPATYPATYAAPSTSTSAQVRSLQVGDMRLRALSASEKRRLAKGDKVITQDMKNGNWNLAHVVKVEGERVVVDVGSGQWKKQWDELYTEDNNSTHFRS